MMRLRPLTHVVCLAALCGAVPASAQWAPERAYPQNDPYYESQDIGEVRRFIDEEGRIVTVDPYGRVVSIEEPARGAPPPGAVLEGRAEYDPYGQYGGAGGGRSPAAIDSMPRPPAGASQRAGLPPIDDTYTGSVQQPQPAMPAPGQPMIETNPAPPVAGPSGRNAKAETAALQVILDRAGISPGVIDGRLGSNVNKAVAAYYEMTGRQIDATNPQALLEELYATGGPAVIQYEITNEDVSGPFVASIPSDYAEKALLPAMSYQRVSEMLAERFHMDEGYLKEINPGADFSRPGTILKVMDVGRNVTTPVTRIIADKGREQVRAYDEAGRLVVAYPATIGSSATPSPSGVHTVARVALDPNYTYNPKINFQQGQNTSVLTIPPGPNGPVGSVWIALSKPTYGIHGTPEPSQIGKTNSHGCIRLTNWDARELAKLVKSGVTVEFVE
ncbi:L,D-transpeptidase [Aureimonas frigidaquae]|uniref:Protein ERFK/SRFK n=1 Tax=Aureimonas frigidaquae TaxID=424757 RepID=A0A0P0Z1H8_9HYPH|nr:L,D-transpeptidase [Aureimonas frigidaquae]BAT27867.1 protein ERFK/SRFK [Aureimonas frigidaquae]